MGRWRRRDEPATSGRKVRRAMITVTEAARVHLAELIEVRGFSGEIAIRLFYGDRGLAMVGDSERAGDVTFQQEGRTVLILGEYASGLLADRCLSIDGSELKPLGNNKEAGNPKRCWSVPGRQALPLTSLPLFQPKPPAALRRGQKEKYHADRSDRHSTG